MHINMPDWRGLCFSSIYRLKYDSDKKEEELLKLSNPPMQQSYLLQTGAVLTGGEGTELFEAQLVRHFCCESCYTVA